MPSGAPASASREFLAAGRHGDMAWMATHRRAAAQPAHLWPEVRSIVMLGMSYAPDDQSARGAGAADRAAPSPSTPQGKDYHDILKGKLKQLAARLAGESGAEVKVFVDTAPVMEKPLAAAAGIGWQGKHTNLVSREHGSWLFLGAIFTTAELPPDAPEADHCGSCRRCLDVCPTAAFPAPYQLDARRCLAYLSIEHKGHIPAEFRRAMGNRVFGCDDCLAVCPWNKFAAAAREARFHARAETDNPPLAELLQLDDARLPRALCRHAREAHRPRPLPAQRADRRRQLRRRQPAAARRGAARRCLAAGARHGRVGDAPARRRRHRRRRAPPAPRARGRQRCARRMAARRRAHEPSLLLRARLQRAARRAAASPREGWSVAGTARTAEGADSDRARTASAPSSSTAPTPGAGVAEALARGNARARLGAARRRRRSRAAPPRGRSRAARRH